MKRVFWSSLLLILLLSACSTSSSDVECLEGICVSLEVDGPIQALQPIPFVISFSTEKDITGLEISMYGDTNINIIDIDKKPNEAKITFQKESSMHWQIDTKGGEEYVITGHFKLPKPTVSYGIFSYGLIASAGHPSIARVTDSVSIYLDAEGNQIENSKAILEMQTDWPAPTPPPDLTIIPPTPWPTIVWPTETPQPSATPPGYPAPGEEGAAEQQILPTLPGYPNP